MTRVDHILVAVSQLEPAMRRWQAAGLPAFAGGQHPGGTSNALIRGPRRTYLELISAAGDGDAVTARVRETPGPLAWALGVDDIDAARAELTRRGYSPGPVGAGARTTPDGERLSWRLCDVVAGPLHPFVPFLIDWVAEMPPGPADGPQVTGVILDVPAPADLAEILQACGLTTARNGPEGLRLTDGGVDVTLREGRGRVSAIDITLPAGAAGDIVLDGLLVRRAARGDAPTS